MSRVACAALALLASLPAGAVELIPLSKGPTSTWEVGDRSSTVVTSDGRLAIHLTVRASPNAGQSYYVLAFETKTTKPVNFSARVSDRPPQRTHFAARAEPGKPYLWGEHLPARLPTVYVLYRPSK